MFALADRLSEWTQIAEASRKHVPLGARLEQSFDGGALAGDRLLHQTVISPARRRRLPAVVRLMVVADLSPLHRIRFQHVPSADGQALSGCPAARRDEI